jgi:hypothetical protein
MKDWLPMAQRMVDEARHDGTVPVRYNDLINMIAIALREASNPVNITEHDPWMHRLATRLADIDIRMNAVETWVRSQINTEVSPKIFVADLTREERDAG